jgi:SAM-dependent methyltransferase
MSIQFRFLMTAEQVVATLLRAHPEDEAMALAVGGEYERFGVLEHALLREVGMTPESSVIDVGCGSGRLAVQLARHPDLRYLGIDVVPTLMEYARRRAARADFRFIHVDRVGIPAPDGSADIIAFFSVLTHLLHEESYLYLEAAHRALKPGGKVVFSFLEYDTPIGWQVFQANQDWIRKRIVASQINVFLHRQDIRLWARRLGFVVETLRGGEPGSVTVGPGEATEAVREGPHAFGQSIAVLRKPTEADLAAEREERATRRAGARQAAAASEGAAGETAEPGAPEQRLKRARPAG